MTRRRGPSQRRSAAHPCGRSHLGRGRSALANGHGVEAPRGSVDSGEMGASTTEAPGPPRTLSGVPLSPFTPQVREWFERAFDAPTPAQEQAWPAIATGEHTLISAPTGSGKTLAAFLWALDRLVAEPTADRTRLVYVSPLKALSYDVEKNLRAPLRGIGADVKVAIRTGDTPQRERRSEERRVGKSC